MRHQKKTIKLGRKAEHRKALLANQVCSLIEHQRIKTTLMFDQRTNLIRQERTSTYQDHVGQGEGRSPAGRENGYSREKRIDSRASDRTVDFAPKECR